MIAGRTRDEHLFGPGPKRILALDGGGVRGIISLAYLERLESILRQRFGPETVLADYFDLIGGASTGAIIATGLALGLPVKRLIATFLGLADKGFRRSSRFAFLAPKFQAGALVEQIRAHVGDTTLGSAQVKTGLAIIAKRIDTGSLWVFHNNPRGRWFDVAGRDPHAAPNKDLKLTQLLRASTAAPSYFAPEPIEIAHGVSGTFIDGAVSPHGNPGLFLFLLATLGGYGFRWPTGAEQLLLASVGTGHHPMTPSRMPAKHAPPLLLAALALKSVMDDCNWLNQTMLQYLGQSPAPWRIDGEIGDLTGDQLGVAPAFHYLRYDMVYSSHWFDGEIGVRLEQRELDGLTRFDEPAISPRLLELARLAARKQIAEAHLPAEFDMG
ncbi:MAG: patatin-like phospholipase family protein [Acetobacteraceae bacterium]